MKKVIVFILLLMCLDTIAQSNHQLWVGQSLTCDVSSSVIGSTYNMTWSVSPSVLLSLSGSGFYREAKTTSYFTGTATVKCSWDYALYHGDNLTHTEKTWTISCIDNPANISPKNLNMTVGGATGKVVCTLQYQNQYSSYADIYYRSSDPSIVEVDSYTGEVIAKSAGTAYITAYSKVSANSPYCTVNVNPAAAPTSISLSKSSISLEAGTSGSLTCNFSPSNASSTVTWSSSNTSVATVTLSGTTVNVYAKSAGNATITATTANGLTATCAVSVTSAPSPTALSIGSITLKVGQQGVISRYLTPTNSATTLTWESLNPSVATIDASGTATAISVGTATIKATTDNNLSATGVVTVVANPDLPTDLIITPTSMTLEEGKSGRITYKFLPEGKSDHINWQTSNILVALIGANQIVTGITPGDATITATTDHGLTATCKVHVTAASTPTPTQPTNISLNPSSLSLQVGQTGTLTPTFLPAGTTTSVTWQSSNTAVATINNGIVTAISPGSVIVSASTSSGLMATCTITVTSKSSTSIRLSHTLISIPVNSTRQLYAYDDSDNEITVSWSSSNSTVATVNSSGRVTAKSPGYADVTGRTSDGATAICTVYVPNTSGKIASGKCGTNLTWDLTDSILTISGTGAMTDYGSSLTGAPWYSAYKTLICAINIEDGCTSIGTDAFNECSNVRMINIPNSVTSIGKSAFVACYDLTTINIPNSVTSLGAYAFKNCFKLAHITLSNNIKEIGSQTFWYCKRLSSISIPYGVTRIGDMAFANCDSLASIVLPSSVTSIGDKAFYYCKQLSSITIPDHVTVISDEVFSGCYALSSINIPNRITSIGKSAFVACRNLTTINIPNSVTSLGEKCFLNCNGLKFVSIGNAVTEIGNSAFSHCSSLRSIIIPKSVTTIGKQAFSYCDSLKSITIPENVTTMGGDAFYKCDNLISIVWNALNCSDPSSSIGHPFYSVKNNITSFTFGNAVEYIPAYLCEGMAKLESIIIPNSVTKIGKCAFEGCSGITSINIPQNVTTIELSAFYNCIALREIINCARTPQEIVSTVLYNVDKATCYLYVPKESVSLYQSANVWKTFSNIIPLNIPETGADILILGTCGDDLTWQLTSDSILTIDGTGDMTVYSSTEHAPWYDYRLNIKSTIINEGVASIGKYAFYNCNNMLSISIPESITNIGYSAFLGSRGLQTINISSINAWCAISFASSLSNPLYYAHKLYLNGKLITNLVIPDNINSIKNYAFYNCSSLVSVTIPNRVSSIGSFAFSGCSALDTIINYAITPQKITSYVFNNIDQTSCTLFVPQESLSAYQNANVWRDFASILPINKATTFIENTCDPQLVENGILLATSSNPVYVYSVTGQLLRIVIEKMNIEELPSGIYILVSPIHKSQRIAVY